MGHVMQQLRASPYVAWRPCVMPHLPAPVCYLVEFSVPVPWVAASRGRGWGAPPWWRV